MRILIVFLLSLGFLSHCSASEIASPLGGPTIGSGPAIPGPSVQSAYPSLDIKPQAIPTKVPKSVQRTFIPNLAEFFKQLDRHKAIKAKAYSIETWVHLRAIEPLFADYEDAMNYLEVSEACLDEAMMNLIVRRHKTLILDPAIDLAKSELDKAEELILFLIEMSKLDI